MAHEQTIDFRTMTVNGPPIADAVKQFMGSMLDVPPESVTGIVISAPRSFSVCAGGVTYDFGLFSTKVYP